MKQYLTSMLLIALSLGPSTDAYTAVGRSQAKPRKSFDCGGIGFNYQTGRKTSGLLFKRDNDSGDNKSTYSHSKKASFRELLWKYGSHIANRLDTLRSAGFHDADSDLTKGNRGLEPQLAFIGKVKDAVAVVGFMYVSWKVLGFLWEYGIRRTSYLPNMLITSKEIEEKADLKAFECQECGATIFLARGRDHLFGQRCSNCGAPGKEAFVNIRKEIVDEIDDDYWETGGYGMDFLSRAEKKKLLKEAGGDEEKANELLNQRLLEQLEAEQSEAGINNQVGPDTNAVDTKEGNGGEPKAAVKGKKKAITPTPTPSGDTGLDELDMDL